MFTRSIRWRLQLWLAFLLVCILSGFGVTAYQLHRINRFSQIDEDLERRVAALTVDVRGRPPLGLPLGRPPFQPAGERDGTAPGFGQPPPGGPFDPGAAPPRSGRPGPDFAMPRGGPEPRPESREIQLSAKTANLFDETDTNGFYYTIWSRGDTLLRRSSNAPATVSFPGRLEADTRIHKRMRDAHRDAFHFTGLGDCVLVGRPITADLAALRRFAWWLVAAGGGVLALGLGGGWLLAGRAIRPVEAISSAASRISAGNLAERINVADTDSELGRLAGVLNSTFARLEAAFAQQKQFIADASHELRTPIAVLISESQATLARQRSAAEYREAVEACLDTAQQMRRLTQSLLELARFDAGQEPIERGPFDLAEQTRACVELVRPLADEHHIRICCDLPPTEIVGDADRLGQVVINLLTNAVHYNKDQGEIRVSTRRENGMALLAVADTGQGIVPEDLSHVFERFYRGDKSRPRASGRNGLGLAICKAIVEAHRGSICVSSEPGVGTTFTVQLPG